MLLTFAAASCSAPLGLRALLEPTLLAFPTDHDVRFLATTAVEGDGNDYKLLAAGQTAAIITVPGPAVIHRIWSTSEYTDETRLIVKLDGAEETVWERGALPEGQQAGDPLRAMDGESYWSYVPIKVESEAQFIATDLREGGPDAQEKLTEATGNKFYLQVAYTEGHEALADAQMKDEVRKRLRMLLQDPLAGLVPIVTHGPDEKPKVETHTLDATTPLTLTDGEDWVIEALVIDAANLGFEQLRGARLVMRSDGTAEPCVDVPLPYLFGAYWDLDDYDGTHTAIRDGKLVFRFPIPIGKGLEISLAPFAGGRGPAALPVTVVKGRWHEPPPYRLCAEYRSMISVRDQPLQLADIRGEGVFVGCTFAGGAQMHRRFAFLEGNEQIYVDGDTEPTWEGTGTEDFFNGAWYFSAGVNSRPLHGLPHIDEGPPPRMAAYRYLVPDRIAFRESLRFDMQHGSRNSVPGIEYHCVSLWYQKPPCAVLEPREAETPAAEGTFPWGADEQEPRGPVDLVTLVILALIAALAIVAGVRYVLRRRG